MKNAVVASSLIVACISLAVALSPAFTRHAPLREAAGKLGSIETLLAKQTAELDSLRSSIARLSSERERIRGDLKRFETRVTAMERRAGAPGGETAAPASARTSAPEAAEAVAEAGGSDGSPTAADFETLFHDATSHLFEDNASAEDRRRLVELARTTDLLAGLIGKLEKKVEKAPEDIDSKLELSRAYLIKLMAVSDVEQGTWAVKAEGQWQAVLKLDSEQWEAQYSLASCWSHYPDFLNKTPDAIRAFERALEIQEKVPVRPEHADTYVSLSRLYAKAGDAEKAREILERGGRLQPSDEAIRKALASMER